MMRWLVAALVLGTVSEVVHAQSQVYLKMDGTPIPTNNKNLWQFVPAKGDKGGYYQCRWVAYDTDMKEINRQLVVYFPNPPTSAKDNENSNYWVYWLRLAPPGTKDIGTFWGRCPTPKHPMYKKMQQQAKGEDLWQIIPKEKRQKNVTRVADLKGRFGPTISTAAAKLPKIAEGEEDTITCIDFSNAIFN